MKKLIISFFVILLVASNVWAYSCPMDMKAIDTALDSAAISEEQLAVVQYLREAGEAFHNSGDHGASVIILKAAKELLGIQIKEE